MKHDHRGMDDQEAYKALVIRPATVVLKMWYSSISRTATRQQQDSYALLRTAKSLDRQEIDVQIQQTRQLTESVFISRGYKAFEEWGRHRHVDNYVFRIADFLPWSMLVRLVADACGLSLSPSHELFALSVPSEEDLARLTQFINNGGGSSNEFEGAIESVAPNHTNTNFY